MNGYREFWNNLIFGSSHVLPSSLERYWTTTIVFAVLCLLIGIASIRLRLLAHAGTLVIFLAYAVALVPFMAWSVSCTGCGASFSHDTARSDELFYLHSVWGGFFAMGIASLWLGVLLSQGVTVIMAKRPSPPPSVTPLPEGTEPGERA